MIDGDQYNITIARQIFRNTIEAIRLWIDLESMEIILNFSRNINLGILSIDVDGNDYWFLEKLISIRPSLIISEFNVALGNRPISVPYDSKFTRFSKHPGGEYYGASISAITYLCNKNGYSLTKISDNGINAFFVRNDLIHDVNDKMCADEIELCKIYPDGNVAPSLDLWDEIKHLPFVDVTLPDASAFSQGRRTE